MFNIKAYDSLIPTKIHFCQKYQIPQRTSGYSGLLHFYFCQRIFLKPLYNHARKMECIGPFTSIYAAHSLMMHRLQEWLFRMQFKGMWRIHCFKCTLRCNTSSSDHQNIVKASSNHLKSSWFDNIFGFFMSCCQCLLVFGRQASWQYGIGFNLFCLHCSQEVEGQPKPVPARQLMWEEISLSFCDSKMYPQVN